MLGPFCSIKAEAGKFTASFRMNNSATRGSGVRDFALTVRDPFSEDEERWITLDKDAAGRLLVVVYTWRGDHARLISARLATPREKSQYEEHHEA
jgi:uncharacterized DUF497 family protein